MRCGRASGSGSSSWCSSSRWAFSSYAVGAHFAFRGARHFAAGQKIVDPTAFTGATIFGLALFAILFLGAVLAVFLTLGVVRGDAETGLLQPLIVRPLGRATMLGSRFAITAFGRRDL